MIATLSIVIPTYNRECTTLVRSLQLQTENIDGLHYEVLVADDGSTDSAVKQANRMIRDWDNCRLIELEQNIGRACIRNYLAREAKYPYLLFLDSDVQVVVPDYLSRYLRCKGDDVVYGGVCIVPNAELAAHNLRYRYELACEPRHSVERRKVSPYQGFRTSNFLMRRDVLLSHPFDERIRHYGYEDVLFGRTLLAEGIPVKHIDNPVAVDDFESNEAFLNKTDEGLRTLLTLAPEMRDYTNILRCADKLHRWHVVTPLLLYYRIFGGCMRRNLTGTQPSVRLYNLYRLCNYLLLQQSKSRET